MRDVCNSVNNKNISQKIEREREKAFYELHLTSVGHKAGYACV